MLQFARTRLHRNLKLLNGLEEFKSGEHIKKDFSEADYSNYYRVVLGNLRRMESSQSQGPLLMDIRQHIFETGW